MSGRKGGREEGREGGRKVFLREREREREREARREFELSEEISLNILHVLPTIRESSRKILIAENSSKKKRTGAPKNKRTFRRTFDVGARERQFPDLRGPWHGRQHLEGLLAVNPLAVADAEL